MASSTGFTAAVAAEPPSASRYARFVEEGRKAIKYVRVYTGDDGNAQFEEVRVESQLLGTSTNSLSQFLQKKANAYAVFTAPPNHVISARKVLPGMPEFFYLINGTATIKSNTASYPCETGTVMIFEDSKGSGHSVLAGPQGFTAFKVLLSE